MFGCCTPLVSTQGNMTAAVYENNILQPIVNGFAETIGHGCANHDTVGKRFKFPIHCCDVMLPPYLFSGELCTSPLHCKILFVYTVFCRRTGQCFSVLRTRHTGVVDSSRGRSYVTEQWHNVPLLRTRAIGEWFTLRDDNTPVHRNHSEQRFLVWRGIRRMDWPVCSKDMNCIENAWSFLKTEIFNRHHPLLTIQASGMLPWRNGTIFLKRISMRWCWVYPISCKSASEFVEDQHVIDHGAENTISFLFWCCSLFQLILFSDFFFQRMQLFLFKLVQR